MKQMKLNPGREKSLLRRHPWIFSGALATPLDEFEAGETVEVVDASGKPLAVAAASPESQLSARVWSFDPAEVIDEAFFAKRIAAAVARREMLG
ncbi:MAG: hypothetical protein PHI35_07505, partial [Victivallaceae bacterium]|nr:hypothetical protein [Victivallaceae bacterium]